MSDSMPPYGQYEVPKVEKCVNFKIGQPAAEMLPLDLIRKASAAKFAETDPLFLQYGNIYGFPAFRESLAGFLTTRYGIPVEQSTLMATNGNTGALSLLISLFCKAGDLVLAEEPTYFLAKSIFKDYKLNCRQIPMDADGVMVEKVKAVLEELDANNQPKPVFMYLVTTAHNPTGRTLIESRRRELVKLAKQHGMLLICDEVYQLLTFPTVTPPPPMFSFDPEGTTVIGMGSFSKILCPALRVGWLQSGAALLDQVAKCGQLDSSGGLNPVSFGIIQKCIDMGILESHLNSVREELHTRFCSLQKALEANGVDYEVPQGGYFVLVKLPEGHDTSELLKFALKNKVAFLPGGGFSETMKNCLRLSFSMYNADDIKVGIERLVQSIQEYSKTL